MSGIRTISDEEIRTLKGETVSCYRLGGGVTGFENLTRVTVGKLSEYASFDERFAKRLIPIDVALEADRRAQSPVITKAMARLQGYDLVPVVGTVGGKPVCEADAHRILSEAMDVSRAILDAHADGRVDSLEKKLIADEARGVLRAIEQLLAGLAEG